MSTQYRIDVDGVIKVADFGLAKDIYGTKYYRRGKSASSSSDKAERMPIRWMAPESIGYEIYTEMSDVVSLMFSMSFQAQ